MQLQTYRSFCRTVGVAAALMSVAFAVGAPSSVYAHEGHAALPSTGATVEGDQVLVSEQARAGLGLKTATVTLKDLSRVLRVRASVELPWDGQAMVTALVPGRVYEMFVEPGESVEAGQELARIESLEVETLQLAMLQAAEEVDLAQHLVEQRRPLAERGAIPAASLLESETQLRQKRVQLAIAERKLMALGLSNETLQEVRQTRAPISAIPITSPIAGVVVHADVRIGQFVDTEQHLFNVVNSSKVLVIGDVLETDAWQIEPGQTVGATFSALPEKAFTGKIERVRLIVDPQQRTIEVVVPIDNLHGWLRPGMSGRLEITAYQEQQAIVCPTEALIHTPDRTFVLLRQGEGKYQRREVKIGLTTREQAEIKDGLFPGDRVIVTGTKLLASMFHTDRSQTPSASAPIPSQLAVRKRTSPQPETSIAIPVAQALVELPPSQKTFATPVIEGRIAKIHVEPGEMVERGQILAELDSQELRTLQLELLAIQEQLRQVTDTIERVEPLARSGGYPQSQFWQQQLEQRTLQHKLQNSERKLAIVGLSSEVIEQLRTADFTQAEMNLAFVKVPVRAPAAGRLSDFDIVPGEVVHANDVLFEIQDLGVVWIQGYVFEQHASRIEVGQTAEIQFAAYPKLQLTGIVARVSPTLHSAAPVLPVWIEVENPDHKLREGMLARVEIVLPSSAEFLAVPSPQN